MVKLMVRFDVVLGVPDTGINDVNIVNHHIIIAIK